MLIKDFCLTVGVINEATEQEIKRLRKPEILPMSFELTIDAWLARLAFWGKIKYYHQEPTSKIKSYFGKRKEVSKNKFIDLVTNTDLVSMFGKWVAKKTALNKMYFMREFIDPIDGVMKNEKMFVEIDLKPELRGAELKI